MVQLTQFNFLSCPQLLLSILFLPNSLVMLSVRVSNGLCLLNIVVIVHLETMRLDEILLISPASILIKTVVRSIFWLRLGGSTALGVRGSILLGRHRDDVECVFGRSLELVLAREVGKVDD